MPNDAMQLQSAPRRAARRQHGMVGVNWTRMVLCLFSVLYIVRAKMPEMAKFGNFSHFSFTVYASKIFCGGGEDGRSLRSTD